MVRGEDVARQEEPGERQALADLLGAAAAAPDEKAGQRQQLVPVRLAGGQRDRSSAPVVVMCELLVARVAEELKDDAKNRIDQIEALWEETKAFV